MTSQGKTGVDGAILSKHSDNLKSETSSPDTSVVPIYRRIYDNPLEADGSYKPKELLGKFYILDKMVDDSYAEQFIGLSIDDGQLYFVEGKEVSFHNGDMRYSVTPLPKLSQRLAEIVDKANEQLQQLVAKAEVEAIDRYIELIIADCNMDRPDAGEASLIVFPTSYAVDKQILKSLKRKVLKDKQ